MILVYNNKIRHSTHQYYYSSSLQHLKEFFLSLYLSEEVLAVQKKSLSAGEWGRFFLVTASTDESREERKSCFEVLKNLLCNILYCIITNKRE